MMKIRICVILVFILITNYNVHAGCEVICRVRYLNLVYHPSKPPTYIENQTLGRMPIIGTGKDGYYEKKWSNRYTIGVQFFTGFEINEYNNDSSLKGNGIYAIVKWKNGGYSFIKIDNWITTEKYLTEEELKFDANGKKINEMAGYDTEDRYWQFEFQ